MPAANLPSERGLPMSPGGGLRTCRPMKRCPLLLASSSQPDSTELQLRLLLPPPRSTYGNLM